MKTKKDLIDNLLITIDKYSSDDKVRDYMQNIYIEKNMVVRTVNAIFKGQLPLEGLNEIEKGIWCVYLYEITQNSLINPEDYFTDLEIQKTKEYYNPENKSEKTDKIILHNVIKVKNQYLCPFVSNYDIYKYWNNRMLTYNFETQRDPKLLKKQDTIVKQANINWESVKDISKIIYEDNFTANLLTWNIRKISNFTQRGVYYDEETKTLTITPSYENNKEVYVDIIDGFHRTLGTLDAVEKARLNNKELEYGFMLSITNFTVREAQDYIRREDKRNPIDKEYIESFEKDEYTMFVDALNQAGEESTNKMKGKIGNTVEEVKLLNKYTTVNVLHDGFRLSGLKFNEPFTNDMYLEHCIEVFNTILGYYNYKYQGDINKIKEETVVYEPNIFVGYITIAKEMFGKNNQKQLLMDLLKNKLDLNRESYDWASLDIFKKNPRSYKKIYDYFEDIVKEME